MERAVGDIVRVKESVEDSGVYFSHLYDAVIIEEINQVVRIKRIETDLVDITETEPSDENTAVFETTTAVNVPSIGLIKAKKKIGNQTRRRRKKEEQPGIKPTEEEEDQALEETIQYHLCQTEKQI